MEIKIFSDTNRERLEEIYKNWFAINSKNPAFKVVSLHFSTAGSEGSDLEFTLLVQFNS